MCLLQCNGSVGKYDIKYKENNKRPKTGLDVNFLPIVFVQMYGLNRFHTAAIVASCTGTPVGFFFFFLTHNSAYL